MGLDSTDIPKIKRRPIPITEDKIATVQDKIELSATEYDNMLADITRLKTMNEKLSQANKDLAEQLAETRRLWRESIYKVETEVSKVSDPNKITPIPIDSKEVEKTERFTKKPKKKGIDIWSEDTTKKILNYLAGE